jgi:CzcA family heavy metal efflux pump
MWIVKVALQRPYTFIVMALALTLLGILTITRTPVDIFPQINIPVVSVVWQYTNLPADEMGNRITGQFERALTTTVNDIEHIESNSMTGVGVIKIFFQPTVNPDMAVAQVTAISQTFLKFLPTGTTPPLVLSYNASTVPVIQLALSSQKLSEQEEFDLANTLIRTQMATVQGAGIPFPYGGKQRQVQVDLDQAAMQAKGVSPNDINAAIAAQNLILPAGTEKIGDIEYNVKLNASTQAVDELNDLPIKKVNGSTLFVRDVAHVRDGFGPQTNMVRLDGNRAVLMVIQKTGNASTLDIIQKVKDRLPGIKDVLPEGLNMTALADQSVFVEAAVQGVIKEGIIAAALTGLMILLFLGSWRSTLIITISIPLSVLASIIVLSAIGQTINIMTLGGLALAVGILVDDATVAIENINTHLESGKEVETAILDGAQQIAVPALVSTLCICIVFVPMFFLQGVAKYLFVSLAEAVVFAMLASYVLSRTLIPTLAKYWLKPHDPQAHHKPSSNPLVRFQRGFQVRFEKVRKRYRHILTAALLRQKLFASGFLALTLLSLLLFPFLGRDFFPAVDGGQIKMHLRAPVGTRLEETARICDEIEDYIRTVIPVEETDSIADNIGLPFSGINLAYGNSGPIGPSDADVLIALKDGHHPTANYVAQLRDKLPGRFPQVSFAFLPADIVSQILNFGLPSPIDIQVTGGNEANDRLVVNKLFEKLRTVPGLVDLRIQQSNAYPELRLNVDRAQAEDLGLTQRDVANNLLISLSGSFQTAPAFWLSPKNGVQYNVVTQTPQYQLDTIDALRNIPINGTDPTVRPRILASLATISRGTGVAVASHYNVQPLIDIYGTSQGRDLGAIAKDIDRAVAEVQKDNMPKGVTITVRGQIQTMVNSFTGLFGGLVFAIVLVYLLMVINFQSWVDPFIIITALPGALAGICWMLFITGTHLSVPALTGAIMCMGVATANAILVVSYARERLDHGRNPLKAALEAGIARFRPVLMTALAMVIGMVPMALGFGEGGEQNAPLGRAVIGGLLLATLATLFFVPAVFTLVHGRLQARKDK